jgi:hypothetical protein
MIGPAKVALLLLKKTETDVITTSGAAELHVTHSLPLQVPTVTVNDPNESLGYVKCDIPKVGMTWGGKR